MNIPNPFSLESEIALITGGGSGLGFGIARSFIAAGARVIIVGRRQEQLEAACAELGPAAVAVTGDITEFEQMNELAARAAEAYAKPVSILVNNAGIHLKKPAWETSPVEFETVMRTHVTAAHALTTAVLPSMLERKHGSILFTASMTSFIGMPNVIAYSAAKTALVGMTRALSSEVAPHGVRVNAIAPGWIESPMLRKALAGDAARENKILARTPMARFGKPEDIGWAATYLCSPAAQFLTGVVLPVDGGASTGF